MTERFRIFEEFQPHVRAEDLESIEGFLEAESTVQEYRVDVDTKDQVRIYIVLMKFSFQAAKDVFLRLSEFMRRSCYNIYRYLRIGIYNCFSALSRNYKADCQTYQEIV